MAKDEVCVRCGRAVPAEGRVPGAPRVLCQACYDQTDSLKRYWSGDWPQGDPRDEGKYS